MTTVAAAPLGVPFAKYGQHAPRSEFRDGIGHLIATDDLVQANKQQFKECIYSMHTGKLREYAEAWAVKDLVHRTEGMPYVANSDGIEGFLISYNEVITGYYGSPEAQMVFKLEAVVRVSHRKIRIVLMITTTGKRDMVERVRLDMEYNDDFMLTRCTMSPEDDTPLGLGSSPQGSALIRPVNNKPLKTTNSAKRIHFKPGHAQMRSAITPVGTEDSVVQAPTFERPCLHNYWDSVRTKKGVALLRCRKCVSQWKIAAAEIVKCKRFLTEQGCSHGDTCEHFHINAKKKAYEERMAGQ
eukprot:TRINITY_DN9507_c0_g1_i2.p1 TRINITY_DN9507_c0_g1~~TRINITY_DN9507_c0_g1_i2.p1  ORF type:complete len:298 (+),score=77.14 TRINITY_DN9507_c0_g1_i2:54-947(+)